MRKLLSKLVVAVMPSATINSVYKKMSRLSNKVDHPGLAIVLNRQQKL